MKIMEVVAHGGGHTGVYACWFWDDCGMLDYTTTQFYADYIIEQDDKSFFCVQNTAVLHRKEKKLIY